MVGPRASERTPVLARALLLLLWSAPAAVALRAPPLPRSVTSLLPPSLGPTVRVYFAGTGAAGADGSTPCVFFARSPVPLDPPRRVASARLDLLAVPLPASLSAGAARSVLAGAVRGERMSKVNILASVPSLVNYDGGLWDNLPWTTWSLGIPRDAAGNLVAEQFRRGKRDAYERMNGKDWPGRSWSGRNVAVRARAALSGNAELRDAVKSLADGGDAGMYTILAVRMLEVEIGECAAALADAEEARHVARADPAAAAEEEEESERAVRDAAGRLEVAREALRDVTRDDGPSQYLAAFVDSVRAYLAEDAATAAPDPPPYPGAYGYAPAVDPEGSYGDDNIYPFTGPLDVLGEILANQLRAEVGVCLIEDALPIDGACAPAGGVVLKRKDAPRQTSTVGDETISAAGDEEGSGLPEGDGQLLPTGGETYLAECEGWEAAAVALHSGAALFAQEELWAACRCTGTVCVEAGAAVPAVTVLEGGATARAADVATGGRPAPSGPATTSSFFSPGGADGGARGAFPEENPVSTLDIFDGLTPSDKARLLLSPGSPLQNRRLPRPRTVRQQGVKVLDDLLLPLVDESVRHAVRVRAARRRGDADEVRRLLDARSDRTRARERAAAYRDADEPEVAAAWEDEAEALGDARADVTQDEGSYDRYLDRDDWYERDRRRIAERNKKYSFGTLLDGIE